MFFAPVVRTRSSVPSYRSFDSGFERFFSNTVAGLNFEQDDKAWTVTLDVPGVPREDLSIAIEGAIVRIDTKAEAKRKFRAAYELPEEIDADASEAELATGVLTLKLVKKVPVSNARTLTIK